MFLATRLGVAVLTVLALTFTLVPVADADSLTSGFVRYFDDGSQGELNLSDGSVWVLSFHNLDLSAYTGIFELKAGDRPNGFEQVAFRIDKDFGGAGAHKLELYDVGFTGPFSTHQLGVGEGTLPFDMRFVMVQNVDDTWDVTPHFRLDSGDWTNFTGGGIQTATSFDLTTSNMTLQFGAGGTGTAVFDPPTADTGNVLGQPATMNLTGVTPTNTIAVDYAGGASGKIYGYSIKIAWDGAVMSTTPVQITEGNLLSDVGSTFFTATVTGTDEITVDAVLLGAQSGAGGPANMFTVEFDGVSCDTSLVDITIMSAVDSANAALTGFDDGDATVFSDLAAPVFTINGPFPDGECLFETPVLDLSALDACSDLDTAWFRVDGGAWLTEANLFADYVGTNWTNAAWSFPLFNVVGEGAHTIEFYAKDDFGNPSAIQSYTFTKDTIDPPAAAMTFSDPDNGRVSLSWTNPVSDLDHVRVMRKEWSAGSYPEYPQPADGYPLDTLDGVLVYSGTAESFVDTLAPRGVYFYRAFTIDCALNVTGGAATGGAIPAPFEAGDRTTNYWLGDVTQNGGGGYDGFVDFFDLNALSAGYRAYSPSSPPVPPFDELDIAPTDDGSRFGIPIPDDNIDFPDLVIFALNFGEVAPKEQKVVRLAGNDRASKADRPTLELIAQEEPVLDGENMQVTLALSGNDRDVKAGSVVLAYDAGKVEWVSTRSSDAVANSGLVFVHSGVLEPGKLYVDLAALGANTVFEGSGDLVTLNFRLKEGDGIDLTFLSTDIRDGDNAQITTGTSDLAMGGSADLVPTVTSLQGAVPNPFNPTTSIRFSLATAGNVRVEIFDVRGRRVRSLLNESREAGEHQLVWNGKNDDNETVASGTYFVNMSADNFKSTSKLTLLR
ncbi:MAG: T9SS type A sorting domain-containing protein [Gemmatimonadetes bacterium]|nr:T9SS type A sorting domain-containing protein [Gemmatimonadota bacterium]